MPSLVLWAFMLDHFMHKTWLTTTIRPLCALCADTFHPRRHTHSSFTLWHTISTFPFVWPCNRTHCPLSHCHNRFSLLAHTAPLLRSFWCPVFTASFGVTFPFTIRNTMEPKSHKRHTLIHTRYTLYTQTIYHRIGKSFTAGAPSGLVFIYLRNAKATYNKTFTHISKAVSASGCFAL